MSWITESNRQKHFLYAIPCGLIGTILFVAGLAVGMEFKDEQYGGEVRLVGYCCNDAWRFGWAGFADWFNFNFLIK